ncbi:methane monooxygenase PmoA-like [Micromonospora pisi]|uniref:Methane monooxygenase PmoA-like n=1 Tax=Micromonospora pisi TaxID=589240 RepID=A0A495JRA1_9ACTN|nr:PmoA family protein [Micromonospora pisi]RKR91058.1 methane monooxygenase PmoA-like [Micromonospora pisi]
MSHETTATRLRVRGETVAEYVPEPDLDPRLSPRPYLHPVRTLAGVTVTDILPEDHPHHLGVSVAVQDVNRFNLWGGRTYVRDQGYTWLEDHGRIVPESWGRQADNGFGQRLRWLDPSGQTLATEDRTVSAGAIAGRDDAWLLDFAYTVTAPADRDVTLGSPATNGRPDGAGYGGFFWRAAPGNTRVLTASAEGEEQVNGSVEPWLAMVGQRTDGAPYTLVFSGLGEGDQWFTRAGEYPGVCIALAYQRTLTIPAGGRISRRHRVAVVDGALTRDQLAGLS